jgi:hypothetical protein
MKISFIRGGKSPRRALNKMLTAPQTQSGYFRSEKNQLLMTGIEPVLLEHLTHSLVNITTTLTRFTAPKVFILGLKTINIWHCYYEMTSN